MIARVIYKNLIEPRLPGEERKRREFILNILLLGSFVLSAAALVKNQATMIAKGSEYAGVAPYVVPHFLLLYMSLILLSRAGFLKFPALFLITLYYTAATYTIYRWGSGVPVALLSYMLIVVMSGVLISNRAAVISTGLSIRHNSDVAVPRGCSHHIAAELLEG